MKERLDELVARIEDSYPAVSSGHDDPMIDGLSAVSELDHFASDLIEKFEMLCSFLRDEAEAGLPLPKPIRKLIERDPTGPEWVTYEDDSSVEAGIRGWIEDKQMRRNP